MNRRIKFVIIRKLRLILLNMLVVSIFGFLGGTKAVASKDENLVLNPDFEEVIVSRNLPKNWICVFRGKSSVSIDRSTSYSGSNSVRLVKVGDGLSKVVAIAQNVKVQPNTWYLLTAYARQYVKKPVTWGGARLLCYMYDKENKFLGLTKPVYAPKGEKFKKIYIIFKNEKLAKVQVRFEMYDPSKTSYEGTAWIDSVHLIKLSEDEVIKWQKTKARKIGKGVLLFEGIEHWKWKGDHNKVELSTEHTFEGIPLAKLTFSSKSSYKWPFLYTLLKEDNYPQDWSLYDRVEFTAYNPNPDSVNLTFTVDKFTFKFALPPQKMKTFSIPIKKIDMEHGVNCASIKKIRFIMNRPPRDTIVYIGNLRLVQDKPVSVSEIRVEPDPFLPGKEALIKANLSRATNWRVKIENKNKKIVRIFEGKSSTIDIKWDGKDQKSYNVPEGEYGVIIEIEDYQPRIIKAGSIIIDRKKDTPKYVIWYEGNTHKVKRKEYPHYLPKEGITIKGAKNEVESFQLVITPALKELKNVRIKVTDLINRNGGIIKSENIEIFLVCYIKVDPPSASSMGAGWWPDALPPLRGSFNVKLGENQPIWFNIHILKKIPAGLYQGNIDISTEIGNTTVPLHLEVWDFTLPDGTHLASSFGINRKEVARLHKVEIGTAEYKELMNKYYWFLVEHRVMPRYLPEGGGEEVLRSEESGYYLNNPRVNAFNIPLSCNFASSKIEQEKLAKLLNYLRGKGWYKKAYCYPGSFLDEPTPEKYSLLRSISETLSKIAPDLRFVITIQYYPGTIPELYGYVNTWCPHVSCFGWDEIRKRQEYGDRFWIYTASCPYMPLPSFLIDRSAIEPRILLWMMWKYNIEGLLYWSVTHWTIVEDPWREPLTYKGVSGHFYANGEGSLLYPGSKVGINGPVGSIRLELIREGIEDYEYMCLLRERFDELKAKLGVEKDREFADFERDKEIVNSVVSGIREYKDSPTYLYSAREKLADEILNVLSPPLILLKTIPEDGSITASSRVKFLGVVQKGSFVKINGKNIMVKPDGKFEYEGRLKRGINHVRIVVTLDGTKKVLKRTFIRVPEVYESL